MNVQVFNYKGDAVTFLNMDGNLLVNATEMAKQFNKRPVDWLRFGQSKEFIDTISRVRNHTLADLVKVVKGGANPGTWMHEDIALEFSRWLSPEFSIWCNDRIKELLQHGLAALNPERLLDPDYVIGVLTALKQERALKSDTQKRLEQAKDIIRENEPLVIFAETVGNSGNAILIRDFAKLLCEDGYEIGQNRLFSWLRANKYLLHDNTPYQQYVNQGLFKVVEKPYNTAQGVKLSFVTKISSKGQLYFADKLKKSVV